MYQRDCKMHPDPVSRKLPVQHRAVHRHCKERTAASGTAGWQSGVVAGEIRIPEDDAKQLCKQAGLLSPVYEFTDRGGCWFARMPSCPSCDICTTIIRICGKKMMRLQIVPGKVTEKFNRSQTFADIDAMFREQDLQAAA